VGLEQVVQEIRTTGRKDADAILEDARKQAQALFAEAQARADDIAAKGRAQAEADVEALRRREVAAGQLDAKKLGLQVEREVLLRLRGEVEARLTRLPDKDRQAHLRALVSRARIPQGMVSVAEKDVENARAAGIAVSGTFKGLGGVIVTSPDGATSEDLRYENLLDDVWRETLHDVAEVLLRGTTATSSPRQQDPTSAKPKSTVKP
jgi:vacuolar-type H+-ATPase subunit E/Vma4